MLRKSHYRFSIMLTTLQTTNHMFQLSLKQWSLYMTDYEKWMCQYIQDSALPYSFLNLSHLGESLIRNSLGGVQQVRSLYLNEVQKQDIWNTKNLFRNEVSRIIHQENSVSHSMDQLEANVLQGIKDWIIRTRPYLYGEDKPWQIYIKRQIKLLGVNSYKEAFQSLSPKDTLLHLVFSGDQAKDRANELSIDADQMPNQ